MGNRGSSNLRYNAGMTAKQALLERIESLSEDEAEELLHRLDWEATEFEVLTDEELKEVLEGEAEIARGESSSLEDVIRRLNL